MEKVEKRVHLNLKVLPDIKAGVERIAKRERRSESNVAEILLEWALQQFDQAGSTLTLIETMGQAQKRQKIADGPFEVGRRVSLNSSKNLKDIKRDKDRDTDERKSKAVKSTESRWK